MGYEDANGLHVDRDAGARVESMDLDELRRRIHGLQDDVARADRRLRGLVRAQPFFAVGLALAAGFLVGRAFRRS
jgi:ElaB/YqjD/DUF883 family membrane-anchored ribosome-binding protein